MSHIVLAALALVQGLTAPTAPGWERVDAAEADGTLMIQPASVTRQGAIARALIQIRMSGPPRDDVTPLFVTRLRFDCGANTAGFEAGDSYDAAGALTNSVTFPDVDMQPIEPGGIEEVVQAIACTHDEG